MFSPGTELVLMLNMLNMIQGGSYDNHGNPHGNNGVAEFSVPAPSNLVSRRVFAKIAVGGAFQPAVVDTHRSSTEDSNVL
jgi:hypothetical protein